MNSACVGSFELDDNGLVVGRLDGGNALELGNERLAGFQSRSSRERIDNIPDRHRFPVVEAHALTQLVGVGVRCLVHGIVFGNGGDEISVRVGL